MLNLHDLHLIAQHLVGLDTLLAIACRAVSHRRGQPQRKVTTLTHDSHAILQTLDELIYSCAQGIATLCLYIDLLARHIGNTIGYRHRVALG